MAGLFDGTSLERPVTCDKCGQSLEKCSCPRNKQGQILPPKDQPPRVRRECRRGGKRVSIISGLHASATNLPAVLKQFKAQFGAGGTVSDGCIELRGDQRDKVVAILRQCGVGTEAWKVNTRRTDIRTI